MRPLKSFMLICMVIFGLFNIAGCGLKQKPQMDLETAEQYALEYLKEKYGVEVEILNNDDKMHTMTGPTYYQGTFKIIGDDSGETYTVDVDFDQDVKPSGEYSVACDTYMQTFFEQAGKLWIDREMSELKNVDFTTSYISFRYNTGLNGFPVDYETPYTAEDFYNNMHDKYITIEWCIKIPESELDKYTEILDFVKKYEDKYSAADFFDTEIKLRVYSDEQYNEGKKSGSVTGDVIQESTLTTWRDWVA